MDNVGVFKLYEDAKLPERMDEGSVCFDLFTYLKLDEDIEFYSDTNEKYTDIVYGSDENNGRIEIPPHHRAKIPTGLKFDIPIGYSLRIHPRSGQAYKNGIVLVNAEGVIDWSYTDPTFILIINNSDTFVTISHKERIAQIELVRVLNYGFVEIFDDLKQKTTRTGGIGSTGTK